eukprot:scaffold171783_cov18-Prasinocladus_malaysianus.AAC.1
MIQADGVDVNIASLDINATPLHHAAASGHTDMVKTFLAAPGIDVNLSTSSGETPLSAAAAHGHLGCVEALLAAPGIDVSIANGTA